MMKRLALFVVALWTTVPCFGDGVLNYSPNPAIYEVSPGDTVVLGATLRNAGDAALYVNDVSITFNGVAAQYLRLNPFFSFFNSVSGTFEVTDPVFIGSLAEILVDPSTPAGTYMVAVKIITNNVPGAQTFTIVVAPSPGGSLSITSGSPLQSGMLGVAYSQTLSGSGGTTPYSNWTITSGSLPPGLSLNSATGVISGTPVAISGLFNFRIGFRDARGAGGSALLQLTIQPPSSTNSMTRVGGFAQIASGGGWKTTMTLINLSSAAVSGDIRFYTDDGNPLNLPLVFPQVGLSSLTSAQTFTLTAGQSFVIETEAATTRSVGWADVYANGVLAGYSIFRLRQPGIPDLEGTVSLGASTSSSVALPFDNTNGYRTGLAVANQSSSLVSVTAILSDQNGAQLASTQIRLLALGHASLFLDELFSVSRNQLGIIQLQSAGTITAASLRFSPSGSFTSVPVIP